MPTFPIAASAMCLTVVVGLVAPAVASDQPLLRDGQLVFPEGWDIPRSMTPVEAEFIAGHPLGGFRGATAPPPTDDVRCASEYEPMDGILLAYEGSSSFTSIVRQMAVAITTIGDANVYIACDNNSESNSVISSLTSQGADMSRVHTIVRNTDSIWIRDYAARYIFVGNCRAMVDHVYNRPRPNDDIYSSYFRSIVGHGFYEHFLVHGGGNYHLNSIGTSAATELILDENPGMSQAEIVGVWRDYQNVETYIHDAFPTSVDATQHIDMWMQIVGDASIIISDWPNNSGSTQDQICDGAATYYAGLGWQVRRMPAFTSGWTHFTYTNMVICNDLVLLPKYNDISDTYDNQALAAAQAAMPGRQVMQIVCDNLAYSAGVMHCITMHMPRHVGGLNPTSHVLSPTGGTYDPGDFVTVRWLSDDEKHDVVNVDIELSTDDGATWATQVAAIADDGIWTWAVPDVSSQSAILRVLARDGDGNVGGSASNPFVINGTAVPGDCDGDGVCNVNDILILIGSWGPCQGCPADLNGDGVVNVNDVLLILTYYQG